MDNAMPRKKRAPRGDLMKFYRAALESQTDDCILWPYHCSLSSGNYYPRITISKKTYRVNRLVCKHVHGQPGDGEQAAHSCDEPRCINPRHLSWKTNQENQNDRAGKREGAKLSESDVRDVRQLRKSGVKLADLSDRYGVATSTISEACSRKYYAWVES